MASEVKADKLSPSSGTDLTLGDASDTVIVPTGVTLNLVDGLGVAAGGTGLVSFTAGDVLYATGTTTLAKLAKGSAEQVLSMNSGATAPEWATAAATAGGTGQTSFTAGDILYANSTTTLTKLGKGTARQGLQTNSGATAPEWVNSPQSLMTAEGDILYASGANTLAKLAKGSDDEVLTLASGVPSWAEAAGGGKIGQVVNTNISVTASGSGTTLTDVAGMTISITPSATDSKVLVMGGMVLNSSGGYSFYQVVNGSDAIISTGTFVGDADGSRQRSTGGNLQVGEAYRNTYTGFMILDSPASTSEQTYKVMARQYTNTSTWYLNRSDSNPDSTEGNTSVSTLTCFEVLA